MTSLRVIKLGVHLILRDPHKSPTELHSLGSSHDHVLGVPDSNKTMNKLPGFFLTYI